MREWHNRFGGIVWRVLEDGVEVQGQGVQRTKGAPVTLTRVWTLWCAEIDEVLAETGIPAALLLMTIGAEAGPLRLQPGGRLSYTPIRVESGFTGDDATPGRISFGPCHVTLQSFRGHMRKPQATRVEALVLVDNLRAAARYIASGYEVTGWDPVLVAARYNAGSIRPSINPSSVFHNRWHIACHVNRALTPWYVHLDRAVQWYGDACDVVRMPRPQVVE